MPVRLTNDVDATIITHFFFSPFHKAKDVLDLDVIYWLRLCHLEASSMFISTDGARQIVRTDRDQQNYLKLP